MNSRVGKLLVLNCGVMKIVSSVSLSSSLSLSIPPSPPHTYTRTHTYTQLIIEDEVALTFGCSSFMEREEWTKAFNIFKKMAPPIGGQNTLTINGKPGNSSSVAMVTHRKLWVVLVLIFC